MLRATAAKVKAALEPPPTPPPLRAPRGSSLPFNECSETSRCYSEAPSGIRSFKSPTDPAKQVLSFHSFGAQEDTEV